MQEFLMRPGFCGDCELWKSRNQSDQLREVYDGQVWKDFQQVNGLPFLRSLFTYALMLNVDWFQPYSHTVSSVGVIYLTILNLPRHKRYKRKNMIIVGIIPGPSEPPRDINSLLLPLVLELNQFWSGVCMKVLTSNGVCEEMVRCAVLCVSCDLPAGRKVCGFLSHSATKGCSKCKKKFPGTIGNMCYAGFDRAQWIPRTNAAHRRDVEDIRKCTTKGRRNEAESRAGCRFSILLDLFYFDASRMLALDPMHNLFLGSAKHMINIWIKEGLIQDSDFDKIQTTVDAMTVPSDIGRIPQKIGSHFKGFKADQFKNWTIYYSVPALFDVLPSEHLECWRHFVLACRILCHQSLSIPEVNLADALLMQFCKRVERMYGEDAISPNMHMHGHLKEVILDYGPIQEFWLFSFERYNGILGKQPTNNRSIEPQLMKRFLNDLVDCTFSYPDEFSAEFKPLYESINSNRLVGSVYDPDISSGVTLPSWHRRAVLSSDELKFVGEICYKYRKIDKSRRIIVNSIFLKYTSISLNGLIFRSSGKKKSNFYVALARWDDDLFGHPPTPSPAILNPSNLRPVNIHYYMKVFFSVDSFTDFLILAHVSWFDEHPARYAFGKPVELWCSNQFEAFGASSFVPIDFLASRCAHGRRKYEDETLLVVVSLVE